MGKRFVSIWFRHLKADWFTLRDPNLRNTAFVISAASHGRMIIVAANAMAQSKGIYSGMVLADARVILPDLQALDDKPDLNQKLLLRLAEWCIRFAPFVSVDLPDGLIIDATGCSHLWGSDENYLNNIIRRLQNRGYALQAAMADTIGAAWAIARFGSGSSVIKSGQHMQALVMLQPAALRLEDDINERLHKLGLRQIRDFIAIPQRTLRRRFGERLIKRLNQALGKEEEIVQPVQPIEPYQERLPCLEPIITLTGIEIALQQLLEILCQRLQQEQKGIRKAVFTCYCIDGRIEKIEISINHFSNNSKHIFKLFELKFQKIQPGEGIEIFILEASHVEKISALQEKLWEKTNEDQTGLLELLDRIATKLGTDCIHRYLPAEHYWPERSFKKAATINDKINEKAQSGWEKNRRPIFFLPKPELIQVTAPVPDYPPMNFRYKNALHTVKKADGPERIEQEWWLQQGQHRDYYCVEDENGCRYWLFRLGHYTDKTYQWFIHGFFA